MTRSEHLEWCKGRALEYVESGDLFAAHSSMVSDLYKHPETCDHPGIMLGTQLFMSQKLETKEQVEKFINDFQ